jgi:hypothetical protein
VDGGEPVVLYSETTVAVDALQTQAAEVHEMTERLEHLTKGTPVWYAGTQAKVEASAALEQAEERSVIREHDTARKA